MSTSSKDTPIFKLLSATKSCSRPDVRLPITLPVLRFLVDVWRRHRPFFHDLRTFFYSDVSDSILQVLRVGKITCNATNSESQVLHHQDPSFLLHKLKLYIAAKLTLTSFKHNRSGRGVHFIFTFFSNRAPSTVPFRLLKSTCNFSVTH